MLTSNEFSVIALAAAFLLLIELLRALPWPSSWLQARPLSCDVCMSSWFGILWCAVRAGTEGMSLRLAYESGSAAGFCLLGLVLFITPRRAPPDWDSVEDNAHLR